MKGMLTFFLAVVFFANSENVVKEFHELNDRKAEQVFVKKYQNDTSATVQAYVCAVTMKQAAYTMNPISKLKIFNNSKRRIDLLIKEHPDNIDLRYVRLLLQEETPSILGYNEYIEEDKEFLIKKFQSESVSKDLKAYIHKNTSL